MKIKWISLALVLVLLSGCSLLPQEKQRIPAPILEKEIESGYHLIEVRRQTVTRTVSASAKVASLQTETVSFDDAGGEITASFAYVGTAVQAGQVLAELETTALEQNLADLKTELGCKELEQQLVQEQCAVALEKAKLELERMSADRQVVQRQNITALERESAAKEKLLQLELEQLQSKVASCEAKLESSVLRAGMDGVVTKISPDQRSYTIANLENCLFVLDQEAAPDFPVGTEVTLELNGETEQAVVCSPKDVNLPEDGCVYLQPGLLSEGISASSRCTVSYIAAEAEDTLSILSAALREKDGEPCVYLLDENGLITTHAVEVGVEGDGVVEILSGLEEGQKVILSY